jgi:hypothetical protein
VTRRRKRSEARPAEVAGPGSEARLAEVAGPGPEARPFDVEGEVSNLRCLLARASALVLATESGIERAPWGDDADEDRRRVEDLSHLVGAAGEALKVAMDNGAQLAARLAKLTAARIDAALAKYSSGGA